MIPASDGFVLGTATGGVGHVLVSILVVLVAAKVAAEVAERIGVPGVLAEIVAGIAIGPSVLGLVEPDDVLRVLGELGVILLLLEVGMEMDLRELRAVGRSSMAVALVGVAAPFAAGYAVTIALGNDADTALFIGAALTATSVGITARVFGDLRALASVEARTVLGAAVADDVLGLVILTVVVRTVTEGSISVGSVAEIAAIALVFLVVASIAGLRLAPPIFSFVQRQARGAGTLVVLALAFTLAFAELATVAKLAPIIGAFVAGLALGRTEQSERIRHELAPVGHLFVPVFFLQIGIDTDVGQMVSGDVLGLASALLVVAVIGKLIAGFAMGRRSGDKWVVGIGMLPRGEVGLIFAGIGLREGVFGDDLYAALLLVVLLTTLATPPLLRWRVRSSRAAAAPPEHADAAAPPGGWIGLAGGEIVLRGVPPRAAALEVALAAAAHAPDARPSIPLLDWLGALGDTEPEWTPATTSALLSLLETGNVRAWRFLEVTGVLERALPELAEAIARRRADPFELDPVGVLSWELPERLHEVVAKDPTVAAEHARLAHPERLAIAALAATVEVRDAAGLAGRLGLDDAAAADVADLVRDAGMLRAVARHPERATEENVLQLATHLRRPERARALYIVDVALNDADERERAALDDLHAALQRALSDSDAIERRRSAAAALAPDELTVDRVGAAPRGLVLSQPPAALARQSAMLRSLPGRRDVRVGVTPGDAPDEWAIDVAARDRPGLLAVVTGALDALGLDVQRADVASWGDGAALEAFVVLSAGLPRPEDVKAAILDGLGGTPAAAPVPGAVVSFDDESSPWYTRCEVRAPDRPGLLHSLASALAAAGADVHGARITSDHGTAVDRFDLTARGEKLGETAKAAIVRAVREGVEARGGFARALSRPGGRPPRPAP